MIMAPGQLSFIILSLMIGFSIAIIYWFESSLLGVFLGWLLGSLAGITLHELVIGLATTVL